MKKWANHFFRADFTPFKEELATIPLGELDDTNRHFLAAALNDIDQDPTTTNRWTDENISDKLSLVGTQVVHNGKNLLMLPSNSTFANCLLLRFPAGNPQLSGVMAIHYN